MLGLGFRPCPTICGCVSWCPPRWGLGCVCVWTRVLVALCLSWLGFVVCVCGFGLCLHSAFFWLGCWGVWPLACAASVSRHLLVVLPVAWGCAGADVGRVCPPPLPFCFFSGLRGGCVVSGPLVSWLCGVLCCLSRSWVCWSPPPLPLSFGPRPCFSFCPPLLQWGVCRRVRVVVSFGGALLMVWCRRVCQGGPPVFIRGAPWVSPSVLPGWGVCPPLLEWVRGFAAVCLSFAPPFFFRLCCLFVSFFFLLVGGSACSSLCLPWAGARTGWHLVCLTGLLLVLVLDWATPRPHGSGGLRTRLAWWPFLSG